MHEFYPIHHDWASRRLVFESEPDSYLIRLAEIKILVILM